MAQVSVIISTYNRAEHFLPRAIRSVLAQTFQDFELMVVDDFSTDNTTAVVREFCRQDPRVMYECTPQNTGYQCAPKNLGIRSTTAPLVAYLDDDNEWLPDHLGHLVAALGDADLVYCAREYRNDPDRPHPSPPHLGIYGNLNNQPWDPTRIHFSNWIDTSDILHTRESILKLGGWNETIRRAADWELMRRYAAAEMRVRHLPEILTTYYWHDDGNLGRLPLGNIAIWTLTKNRLWHLQQMLWSLREMTQIPFDHFVLDQGSTDGTEEFLAQEFRVGRLAYLRCEPENIGISRGSNHLLDIILPGDHYHWIVKCDQDMQLCTLGWLERMINRWKEKHVLSPHILGLVQHPGGAPRTRFDHTRRLGYAKHLGGAINVAPRDAWRDFGRWIVPAPAHGLQDGEFSRRLVDKGWKLAYVEDVLARHLANTPEAIRRQEQAQVI